MGKFTCSNSILSIKEIERILELDKMVYASEYQSTLDQIIERFNKNKESFTVVKSDGIIIGYMCYYPISDRLFNKMSTEQYFYDADITAQDVLEYTQGEFNVYVTSIVVAPEHQKTGAAIVLRQGFNARMEELSKRGIKVKTISAIPVSDDVTKFLKRVNFEMVNPHIPFMVLNASLV